MDLTTLINTGRQIQQGLVYEEPGPRVIRTFSVYRLADQDQF